MATANKSSFYATHITSQPPVHRVPWLICCLLVAVVFLVYVATSFMTGQGEVVLPLDDTYIHFQYARQAAAGQPYVYNPGDPPTSGATSFLYPYVLAVGYLIGFQSLNLGLWALAVGALALLAATWTVFLLARHFTPLPAAPLPGLALGAALLFGCMGAAHWHAMSGMETALVMAFALLTLHQVMAGRVAGFAVAAALLALIRPEGSIMALIAVVGFWWGRGRSKSVALPLLLPLLALMVQPALNYALTGSFSSTGGQAKSILGTVPLYWDEATRRIIGNFARMWWQFLTGTNGDYTPFLVAPLALVGWLWLMAQRERRLIGLIIFGWLVAVSGAVATLDTAFWHFKRYHMPLMALFYPLAAWGLAAIIAFIRRHLMIEAHLRGIEPGVAGRRLGRVGFALPVLLVILLFLPGLSTTLEFWRLYQVNVANVMAQPLPMARWLGQNTAPGARIAVHDVGMMRYIGQRYTIDMVGLTTPGAADAWRNGPGAVAAFLDHHDPPPDYVAAYTTARGLNYLADTGIYGELLAGFTAQYHPADNVALGAEFQGISAYQPPSGGGRIPMPAAPGFTRVDALNVAHIPDEEAHDYIWKDFERMAGFSTEVYEFNKLRDTGRRINGEERFTMRAQPGQDALLLTRVHPANGGTLAVYINGALVGTRWLPAMPGQWLEITTFIPAEYITDEAVNLRILPNVPGGHYMPYYHAWWQGEYIPPARAALNPDALPVAAFQEGAFTLYAAYDADAQGQQLRVSLLADVDAAAQGDYKVFLHLYADPASPPVAQVDGYLAGLPGNWLPGALMEAFTLSLTDLPPGAYTLALGFYNPNTLERLEPQLTGEISPESITIDGISRRVFIGEVQVKEGEGHD